MWFVVVRSNAKSKLIRQNLAGITISLEQFQTIRKIIFGSDQEAVKFNRFKPDNVAEVIVVLAGIPDELHDIRR